MNTADKKRSLAVDVYVLVFGQLPPRKIAPPVMVWVWVKVRVSFRFGGQPDYSPQEKLPLG